MKYGDWEGYFGIGHFGIIFIFKILIQPIKKNLTFYQKDWVIEFDIGLVVQCGCIFYIRTIWSPKYTQICIVNTES